MIFRRVVSCTLSDPLIASSLALSFSAISSYPLRPPGFALCLSIKPRLSSDCTIWEIFSLLSVLPSANAICRVSTEGFTPSQQEIYDNVYFVETIRGLIGNRAFIMVCKFFHKPDWRFLTKFEKLRRTPDFKELMACIRSLSVTFLQPCERKQSDFMSCLCVVEVFYARMTACDWNFMFMLLEEDDEDSVIKLLEEGCSVSEVDSPLSCRLRFPDHFANGSGLKFLSILSRGVHSLPSVRMPKELLVYLNKKKNRRYHDATSQVYRIMLLLCTFIGFVTSDTPHRDFICSFLVFLKSNQETTTFRDLKNYLDLSTDCDFYRILSDFCNFADPSMHCTEITKRSFLCFFDLMRNILSHKRFMCAFSKFLNELNEKKEEEEPIDDLIDELIEKIIHQITINLERYLFLKLVQPFKFTDCSECHVPLSHENYKPLCRYSDHDNGLCDECDDRKKMDAYLKSRMENYRWVVEHGQNVNGWMC